MSNRCGKPHGPLQEQGGGQGQEGLRNCLHNPGKIQAVKVPHYFKVKEGIFFVLNSS